MRSPFEVGGTGITRGLGVSKPCSDVIRPLTHIVTHSDAVILGLSMTAALTQIVKVTVGRPRPGEPSWHVSVPYHS